MHIPESSLNPFKNANTSGAVERLEMPLNLSTAHSIPSKTDKLISRIQLYPRLQISATTRAES